MTVTSNTAIASDEFGMFPPHAMAEIELRFHAIALSSSKNQQASGRASALRVIVSADYFVGGRADGNLKFQIRAFVSEFVRHRRDTSFACHVSNAGFQIRISPLPGIDVSPQWRDHVPDDGLLGREIP